MDIQYLLWLQELRSALGPGVEAFWNLITSIPTSAVIIVIPLFFYWCYDKKSGQFLLFNLAGGSVLNQTIKNTACVYRPWIRDARIVPSEKALSGATGYSFPSGHTQSSVSLFGSLAVRMRKRAITILSVVFILMIGFSRNYLGCHTPQDVAVAMVEAGALLWGSTHLFQWVEARPERRNQLLGLGLVVTVFFLVYVTVKPYPLTYVDGVLLVDPVEMQNDCYSAAGMFGGYLLGTLLEEKYIGFDTNCSKKEKILRFLIGAVIVGGFYAGSAVLKGKMDMRAVKGIRYCTSAFLGVFVVPLLFEPIHKFV